MSGDSSQNISKGPFNHIVKYQTRFDENTKESKDVYKQIKIASWRRDAGRLPANAHIESRA